MAIAFLSAERSKDPSRQVRVFSLVVLVNASELHVQTSLNWVIRKRKVQILSLKSDQDH